MLFLSHCQNKKFRSLDCVPVSIGNPGYASAFYSVRPIPLKIPFGGSIKVLSYFSVSAFTNPIILVAVAINNLQYHSIQACILAHSKVDNRTCHFTR